MTPKSAIVATSSPSSGRRPTKAPGGSTMIDRFSPDLQQTNGQQAGDPWHPRQHSSNDQTHPDLGRSNVPPDQCHSIQAADAAHPVQRSTNHARTAHLAARIAAPNGPHKPESSCSGCVFKSSTAFGYAN
ncbi:hypothetical protein ACLOJK_008273 [Asimina triloba]